jgi:hypothetical protein
MMLVGLLEADAARRKAALAQDPLRELVDQKPYQMHILPISRTVASTGFYIPNK